MPRHSLEGSPSQAPGTPPCHCCTNKSCQCGRRWGRIPARQEEQTPKTREQQHFNSLPGRVNIDWLRGESQLILLFLVAHRRSPPEPAQGNPSANISGRCCRVIELHDGSREELQTSREFPWQGNGLSTGRREHGMLRQSRKPSPARPCWTLPALFHQGILSRACSNQLLPAPASLSGICCPSTISTPVS